MKSTEMRHGGAEAMMEAQETGKAIAQTAVEIGRRTK